MVGVIVADFVEDFEGMGYGVALAPLDLAVPAGVVEPVLGAGCCGICKFT